MVNEKIFAAVIRCNKTVTFIGVKPLNGSCTHAASTLNLLTAKQRGPNVMFVMNDKMNGDIQTS